MCACVCVCVYRCRGKGVGERMASTSGMKMKMKMRVNSCSSRQGAPTRGVRPIVSQSCESRTLSNTRMNALRADAEYTSMGIRRTRVTGRRPTARTAAINVQARAAGRPGVPGGPGGRQGVRMMRKKLEIPEVDSENPQFIIFVRSAKVKMWYPLNIVSGGPMAKGLLSGMENDFLKGMASGALLSSLQDVVYKDIDAVENAARDTIKAIAGAKKLVYGFKIMDADDPEGSVMPKGVKEIPEKGSKTGTGFDGLQEVADNLKDVQKMFGGGD